MTSNLDRKSANIIWTSLALCLSVFCKTHGQNVWVWLLRLHASSTLRTRLKRIMKRPPSSAQSRSIPLARALFSFRASLRARSGATSTADRDALADALSAAASSAAPLDHTAVTAALRALASAGEEDGVVDLDWVEDVEKIREEVGVLVKARDDEGDKELGNRILRGAEGDGQGQANAGSGKGQASWENVPLQALGPVPARPGDGQSQAHASRSEDRSRRGRGQWSAGAEEVKFPLNTFRLNRTVGTGEEYAYTIDHVLVSRPVKLVLIMKYVSQSFVPQVADREREGKSG